MRIALNAMQVRAAKSGVGQYIHGLLEAMVNLAPTEGFLLYNSAANVENYRFGAPNLENLVWGLQSARSLRLAHEYAFLPRELRRRGVHVFHGLSNFLPVRKVCPYVVTIHDLSYYVDPARCPYIRRQYWYAMTRRTVSLADEIITVSENSRRDIERFFPAAKDKITVIPEAAHARFRPLPIDENKSFLAQKGIKQPYVLFVGTLEPGKNIHRVIRAFDTIADEFPDHKLLVAGDRGWLFEEIFQAARESRAQQRIQFLGHVSDLEVVELLNLCDVFVFPSLYEGFGLPPLEAMACGAPVVTSNTSSIPEVVGDAALTIDPTSVDQIADAIRRILSDPQLRSSLREKGLAQAAKFSWEHAATETLNVYRRVAS